MVEFDLAGAGTASRAAGTATSSVSGEEFAVSDGWEAAWACFFEGSATVLGAAAGAGKASIGLS